MKCEFETRKVAEYLYEVFEVKKKKAFEGKEKQAQAESPLERDPRFAHHLFFSQDLDWLL